MIMSIRRYAIPFLPCYFFIIPILFIWIPVVAVYLMIAGVHLFYPYTSAYSYSAESGSEQLRWGLMLTLVHWVLVLSLFMKLSKSFSDKGAIFLGLSLNTISIIIAHVILEISGYSVYVHLDF